MKLSVHSGKSLLVALVISITLFQHPNRAESAQDESLVEFRIVYEDIRPDRTPAIIQEAEDPVFLGPMLLSDKHLQIIELKEVEAYFNGAILTFTEEGRQILSQVKKTNIGRRLAALINNEVIYAAIIQEPIESDQIQLLGNYTVDEITEIIDAISSNIKR